MQSINTTHITNLTSKKKLNFITKPNNIELTKKETVKIISKFLITDDSPNKNPVRRTKKAGSSLAN